MQMSYDYPYRDLPLESRNFAHKMARSVLEISRNLNSVTDVVIFLEVMGYNANNIKKYGFKNLQDLAVYIYGLVDIFGHSEDHKSNSIPIPSFTRRLGESLATTFHWFASLVLLFFTGVSLWMAQGLPVIASTALISGVFFGIILTEGLIQIFNRLFTFYHAHANKGELKRILKRGYILLSITLLIATISIYFIGNFLSIPREFIIIFTISAITLAFHRFSFIPANNLRRIGSLTLSYLISFGVLYYIYFFAQTFLPDATIRYFTALIAAFGVLSLFALYNHYDVLRKGSISGIRKAPHFFTQLSFKEKTLRSKFHVQLWETFPYFLFGTFYFILVFADRFLSWIFNPTLIIDSLPIAFNFVYHLGADISMTSIVLPTTIIQQIIMIPIFAMIVNHASKLKSMEIRKMDNFIWKLYGVLILASLVTSILAWILLNYFIGPEVLSHLGGTRINVGDEITSLRILQYASIGNIFLTLFTANSFFLILLNGIKGLVMITIISALIVVIGGIIQAQYGFSNIVLAYVGATFIAALLSGLHIFGLMRDSSARFFARFV